MPSRWTLPIAALICAVICPAQDSDADRRAEERGLALSYLRANRFGEAETLLRKLIASDSKDGESAFLLGGLLYRQGYYSGALEPLAKSLQAAPGNREAQAMHTVCLLKTDQTEAGQAEARKLLSADPPLRDIDLVLTLAESSYERGNLEEALALADKAVSWWPRHPIPYYWRARILLRERKLDQAAEAAGRSVSLAPQLPFAHDVLARIYTLQGRAEDAGRETAWLRDYEDRRVRARAQ